MLCSTGENSTHDLPSPTSVVLPRHILGVQAKHSDTTLIAPASILVKLCNRTS